MTATTKAPKQLPEISAPAECLTLCVINKNSVKEVARLFDAGQDWHQGPHVEIRRLVAVTDIPGITHDYYLDAYMQLIKGLRAGAKLKIKRLSVETFHGSDMPKKLIIRANNDIEKNCRLVEISISPYQFQNGILQAKFKNTLTVRKGITWDIEIPPNTGYYLTFIEPDNN